MAATADGGYIVTWVNGTGTAWTGGTYARQFRAGGSPASGVICRPGGGASSPSARIHSVRHRALDRISAVHVDAVPLR